MPNKSRKVPTKRKTRHQRGPTAPIRRYTPVTVTLKHVHSINGKQYAGTVTVRGDLANALLSADSQADATESNFRDRNRAFLVGPGGRAVRVNPDVFDDEYANATVVAGTFR